jgi:hypothetical protein
VEGGLKATYYYQDDWLSPVIGNEAYRRVSPYHDPIWCDDALLLTCDSTQLDTTLSFDWGLNSPLPNVTSYPSDHYSIHWEGYLKPPTTDVYTLYVTSDYGARIVINDDVELVNAFPLSQEEVQVTLSLDADVFTKIDVYYQHNIDEAHFSLAWSSQGSPVKQVIPSSSLFHERHIADSPKEVVVVPGAVDEQSTVAFGDGLADCTTLSTCSFTIQARDSFGNNIFNRGSDAFVVMIEGKGGDWSGDGRVNDVTYADLVTTIDPTVVAKNWEFVGTASVVEGDNNLYNTSVDVSALLVRGDVIIVGEEVHTVSSENAFTSSIVPLTSVYKGITSDDVQVYVSSSLSTSYASLHPSVSSSCETGTYYVTYHPLVRGDYELSIALAPLDEIQSITTSVDAYSSLSGSFNLTITTYIDEAHLLSIVDTVEVAYDEDSASLEALLESMENIVNVSVTTDSCDQPSMGCTWLVTFHSFNHSSIDIPMMEVASMFELEGNNAQIIIEEVQAGTDIRHIIESPFSIHVVPNDTDARYTTAYGQGLVEAQAGHVASFFIQSKDAYGNNRLDHQVRDEYFVYAFDPSEDPTTSTAVYGTVSYVSDGLYAVEYTPTKSVPHRLVVLLIEEHEVQTFTLTFSSLMGRSGYYTMTIGDETTEPLLWDATEEDVSIALSSLASLDNVLVSMDSSDIEVTFTITFQGNVGDVDELTLDVSSMVGLASYTVSTETEGSYSHIKTASLDASNGTSLAFPYVNSYLSNEVQKITSTSSSDGFVLSMNGQRTSVLDWNVTEVEMKQELEQLLSVGTVTVTKHSSISSTGFNWTVTFEPTEGYDEEHLRNFGNLPLMVAYTEDGLLNASFVSVRTIQDGVSPFLVDVSPDDVDGSSCTAVD